MIQDIELDEEKFNFEDKDDVFSISNVLKQCELILNPVFELTSQTCENYQKPSSQCLKLSESNIPKIEVSSDRTQG